MTRVEEYEQARKALNLLYGAAVTEAEMNNITLMKQQLAQAYGDKVIIDIKNNAAKMQVLIASLEHVMTPTRAAQIQEGATLFSDVLKSWNQASAG